MDRTGNDRGFVLVLVLVTMALLSAGAIGVMMQARGSATNADLHLKSVETRAVLDAASARVFHAIASTEDPMSLREAHDGKTINWRFGKADVEISIEDESGKVDLNHAPVELVIAALDAAHLDTRSRNEFADALQRARNQNRIVPSAESLLEQCARLSGASHGLNSYLTVLTEQEGISFDSSGGLAVSALPGIRVADLAIFREHKSAQTFPAEDPRLSHLHPYLSDGVGFATLSIRARANGFPELERRIVFGRLLNRPYVFQIQSSDQASAKSNICG